MKLFTFIMAFIFLALSCMPCMDAQNELSVSSPQQLQSTTDHGGHNDADKCSPLCVCGCCSTVTFLALDYKVNTAFKISSISYSTHLPFSVIEISLPVWQPPKLVA